MGALIGNDGLKEAALKTAMFTHGATVCAGCSGCETNLSDGDLAEELELEAMMSERPDGNSGPPSNQVNVWHVTPLRMVPTPRGKAGEASRPGALIVRHTEDKLASVMASALGRERRKVGQ